MNAESWIVPEWPATPRVGALSTTRLGGEGAAPYDRFNLALHVGDDPLVVAGNRALLHAALPAEPAWLEQVHGADVVDLDCLPAGENPPPRVDAALSRQPGRVCAVMTADCLPVLFRDLDATVVAAAHAGWRGLHAGVLENTVRAMAVAPERLCAWLGPAIGPAAFEVGDEVREAFLCDTPAAVSAFQPGERPGKWLADLYGLARLRLEAVGVRRLYGGGLCTYTDAARFFSYRRDGATGRMVSVIWLRP
ncbi:peptidoglycan editing factor PgeF [Pseudothauera nasutitermitis]|uniref:Purine nucleoside phosphorylase n=1 Tax=Pseudothauera nasutitermitis TaxID=2565930 RepID=A0A4S4B735_9RHOO|nr:peptidoglycan editing factor PgeF [Pseudothauera nasutitermitis]THF66823.1 peptidoglycan editing factor PgeF [Pseudothauera nasutitermitis]